MKTPLRIRDWDQNFEISQSRKCRHGMKWVAVPNKHDGKSFRRIMKMDRRCEIYAAWHLLVQVASKCPDRGVLADSNGPLTFEDLELKTGMPAAVFEYAIPILASDAIGWLEEGCDTAPSTVGEHSQTDGSAVGARWEHAGSTLPLHNNTRHNNTRQDNTHTPSPQKPAAEKVPVEKPAKRAAYKPDFEAFWEAYPRKTGKDDAAKVYERVIARLNATDLMDRPQASEYLLQRATAFARAPAGQAGQYTPHPSTWLNKGRYGDPDSEWRRTDRNDRGITAGDGQITSDDNTGF